MISKLFSKYETLLMIVLLIIVSALVYLPRVGQIGYLNDDWYLMYSAHAYGSQAFIDIFSVDRPARALVMMPAYMLFGDNAVYYNLSAYLFRLISALGFLWFLRMLWIRQRKLTFLAALLFLIYPGFLSQLNGIDYQSQMVSLAAAMLSIALSLRASLEDRLWLRTILFAAAVLLGWFYLGLVEYFLGFEYLRLAGFALLSYRGDRSWKGILAGVKRWLPNILIPLIFLTWRIFFFHSERDATDIGFQMGTLLDAPFVTMFWWAVHLVTDSLDVLLFAWSVPFYTLFTTLQLRDVIVSGLVAAVLILGVVQWMSRSGTSEAEDENGICQKEMLIFGLSMLVAGMIPIILVNRGVDFASFSRYALASATGACLVLVALISMLPVSGIRYGIISLLIAVSVFTHHANALQAVSETQAIRSFWWQVSWRIPQLERRSTLIASTPTFGIDEDYFVWGPANMIYYPERWNEKSKIRPGLFAAVLNDQSKVKVFEQKGEDFSSRKNIHTFTNYGNFLLLSRPSSSACVHVINGAQPELSSADTSLAMVIAPYSMAEKVTLDSPFQTPPEIVFGEEPAHDWCFYFERADLARQRGQWDEVLKIGEQAFGQGLEPQDPVEWIPFLQAYGQAGDVARLTEVAPKVAADAYVLREACQFLSEMSGLSPNVTETINTLYCPE
jgi:hypothetical protein